MGTSFGGYSAVQASIMQPNLFKCAIATSGVYELNEHFDSKAKEVKQYYDDAMGNEALRKQHSPIYHLAKLKTPLLLTHGGKDYIADYDQSDELKHELEDLNKNFEWLEFETEGHYFYNEKNRKIYYKKVTDFLQKYNPVVPIK